MYQATLRLKGSIQTPPTAQDQTITKNRPFAIRRLGVRGSSIFLDQKRFVLRAVRRFSAAIADLKSARHVASALYVDEPSDDFLREASEEGVLLAVHCSQACSPGDPAGELRGLTSELARLSRWPAVAVVVLNPNVPDERTLRVAAPNVLFAQQLFPNSTDPPRAWAHLAWCELGLTGLTRPQYELPLIAHRVMPGAQTIDQLRRACDQLQANLAPLGDFAGYVVSMADVANNQA